MMLSSSLPHFHTFLFQSPRDGTVHSKSGSNPTPTLSHQLKSKTVALARNTENIKH